TIVSVVTLVWGISPRQPSGKNIIRWLLKKRTNGSVRYCQYTSVCRDLFFTDSNDACQYIINMRIVSVTDALLRKKTASTDFRWRGAGSKG
ncbi:hypothetical protein, partial [Escherichia coli]|uniref:hypothetical protein n=1 Tax=Escherichia coli TaxID=562 RepID=UPI002343125B